MSIVETSADGLRRTLRVVIPAAQLNAQIDAKIGEAAPKVNRAGFRPGKVPPKLLRQLHGPALLQDIIREEMERSTKEALGEDRPAMQPRFTLESDMAAVEKGGADLAFKVELDVLPDFEPADPAGITIERLTAPVEESQIEETLASIAAQNRSFAAKEGPAVEGDLVTLDFDGKLEGVAFEGGKMEGARVEIGAKRFIPGFEEQLVGVAKGESRVLNVSFPQDYPAENLKGQAATFDVVVHEIEAPQTTAVDDGLAVQMGFADLAALREAVKERLAKDLAGLARGKAKRALFDELDKLHDFALPQSMVDQEFAQIWTQVEADRTAGRLDDEDKAKDEDTLRADYRRIAERRVRLGLVLAEVGRRNEIEVSQDSLRDAVIAEARRYPGAERQVLEYYQNTPQALAELRAPLYEERVVDFLLELVKSTTRTVSLEELRADDPAP
jgi:trigger factor